MVKPIPDNVKETLTQLSSAQQVVLRSYIATLRSEIVSFEEQKLNTDNNDPHAHYHGDVKCTADHGHVDTEHTEHHHEHVHTEHFEHEHHHDHKEKHHDHGHQEHKHTEKHDDNHQHTHHEHTEKCGHDHKEHHHDDHGHIEKTQHMEHHEHDHGHGHAEKTEHIHHEDNAPAWKKAALSSDPTAAPFGGTWQAESNISATDGMAQTHTAAMEE